MKRIKANFYRKDYYRYERIPPDEKQKIRDAYAAAGGTWDEGDYWMVKHELPDGRLYSGSHTPRPTKITPDDLPAYYIEMRDYKQRGYIKALDVTSVVYKPSPFHNHSFKDDSLYISYTKDLTGLDRDELYEQCDEWIWGYDIIDFIRGMEIWSPEVDVSQIKQQMVEQYNAYVDCMNEWDFKHDIKRDYIERFEDLL